MFAGQAVIWLFIAACVIFQTYWPSPVTSRDLLDYGHPNTIFYDTRTAAQTELQVKSSPTGEIPLQSITNTELWLQIAVECIKDKDGNECDNVLNPTGVHLLDEIDKIIATDPTWNKICWR